MRSLSFRGSVFGSALGVGLGLGLGAGGVLTLVGCGARPGPPAPGVVVPPSRPHERETPLVPVAPVAPVAAVAPTPMRPAQPVAGDPCDPFADLRERKEGDLTVPVEPRPIDPTFFGRMRHHSDGALTLGAPRVWFGPRVPRFVPLHEGSSELHLLEPAGAGYVAVYRDPYGAGSCGLDDRQNCRVIVSGFEPCGKKAWSRDLREVMSRPTNLELQDVRVDGGIVYFNEACQSYSREAGGACSALIAFDPVASRVVWRTRPLVSNNRLLVVGAYVVAAYGFTAEPDAVSLVRRRDGVVTSRLPLATAHEDLTVEGDVLVVRTYPGTRFERFTLAGLEGDAARLVPRR